MADVPLYQQPAANPVQPTGPEPVAPTAVPGVTGATGIPGIPGALAAAPPQVPNIDLSGGMPQSAPSPQMPQGPQQPNQDQQPGIPAPFDNNPSTRGGPVKNALTRMLYGMGQAGLQHVGLPTDYDIQKTQFDQAMKARQVQVDQMHEQLLQRTQDYNQTLITTRDPYTGQVVQVAPRDLGKVLTAGITAQSRADVAATTSQFKSTPQGLWNTRPSDGGDPKLIPNSGPAGTVLTPEMAQEMGIPTNSPMVGQWMNVSQLNTLGAAYMRPAATTSSTTDPLGLTTTSTKRKVPPGQLPVATAPGATSRLPGTSAGAAQTSAGTPGGFVKPPPGNASASSNSPLMDMAIQLVEGNADPSQVPKRGSANLVIAKLANAYSMGKYGKPFDMAQVSTDFKYANQTSTQNTLKYLDSLTGHDNKSGNFQTLLNLSNSPELARTQFPPLNDVQAWAKLKTGSGPQAAYAAAITEVSDQIAKILQGGGGGTSDAKLKQAQDLLQKGFTTGQMKDTVTTLRDLLVNRKTELIGDNRYLKKQFGSAGGGSGAATPTGGGGAPTGATHTAMGSDKKLHYTNAQGQDLGVAQ